MQSDAMPENPSHPVVTLRLLAWKKGYEFDRLRGPDSWMLIRIADQAIASKPDGDPTFTFEEARAYLEGLPDATPT